MAPHGKERSDGRPVTMIRLHLILVLLIGMIGPAAAAVPRACLFAGGPEAVPFLTAQGPPILVGDVDLDSQSAVTPYKVRTFSDTAKREQYRSEQCLRYEVENID